MKPKYLESLQSWTNAEIIWSAHSPIISFCISGDVYFFCGSAKARWSANMALSFALMWRMATKLLFFSSWPRIARFCLPHNKIASIIHDRISRFLLIRALKLSDIDSNISDFIPDVMRRNSVAASTLSWCLLDSLRCRVTHRLRFPQSVTGDDSEKVFSFVSCLCGPNKTQGAQNTASFATEYLIQGCFSSQLHCSDLLTFLMVLKISIQKSWHALVQVLL